MVANAFFSPICLEESSHLSLDLVHLFDHLQPQPCALNQASSRQCLKVPLHDTGLIMPESLWPCTVRVAKLSAACCSASLQLVVASVAFMR